MFQAIAKNLRGVTDAFPFRVRAESFDFVSPDVGVGFGFQIAMKVPGIGHGNAGQWVVRTEKKGEVAAALLPSLPRRNFHVASLGKVV